jgi:Vesicle transport v-SNARE protein.
LENQIDVKLVSLSKLGSSLSSSTALSASSDKAPLLDDSQNLVGDASAEVADLLARLAQVNEGMADFAAHQSQSAAIHHTLQRHRDILLDYRQEFNKTKANLEAIAEREDLLSSVHRDINDYRKGVADGGTGRSNKRMDLLLKETESARNSERLIDDQINIAIESRETLVSQRVAFKAIQTKLNDIANRFPVINSLVQKINIRKRRDTLILGLVIGLCLTFLIWYAFW